MNKTILQQNINNIKEHLGNSEITIVKNLLLGKDNYISAAIIYINGLSDKALIDSSILTPLMLHIKEDLNNKNDIANYLCQKYLALSDTELESDLLKGVDVIKHGKSLLLIDNCPEFIICDTRGGEYRGITEPSTEASVIGPKESFVENLEVNISMIKRRIKDKTLKVELTTLGSRTQSDLAIIYMDDLVDKSILEELKYRIANVSIDGVNSTSVLKQCIGEHPYSLFPQIFYTERPDVIQANLLEGKIAISLEGSCSLITTPSIFVEFFQTVDDYYHRTFVGSFNRILRYIAVFLILTLPSIYITLMKFNSDLIPLDFIESIILSRKGIALTPFMSILSMNLIIEFLREGGLRLPVKVGQTLSVVGGIIIGDAAIEAKIVSPSTLLVVGIATASTFLIPSYEMSLSIRMLGFPILILCNYLGMLGLSISWFFILSYLCSLDNFGVPYFQLYKSDMKDTFIRGEIWKMNKRPKVIPNNDEIRQQNFRWKFKRRKNE